MRAAATARPRGRPPVITTERVLAVAREVFLERGIRATTSEVARRAGVSEGVLFHRFGTKDALFRAAMNFDPSAAPAVLATLPSLAGSGDLRKILREVGRQLLELGGVALPVMMMAWSNPKSDFSFEKMTARSDPRANRAVDALRTFFMVERKKGRIARRADPDVLARTYLGALHHQCMQEIFVRDDLDRPTRERFVARLVDLLLDGAGVRARRRSTKGAR